MEPKGMTRDQKSYLSVPSNIRILRVLKSGAAHFLCSGINHRIGHLRVLVNFVSTRLYVYCITLIFLDLNKQFNFNKSYFLNFLIFFLRNRQEQTIVMGNNKSPSNNKICNFFNLKLRDSWTIYNNNNKHSKSKLSNSIGNQILFHIEFTLIQTPNWIVNFL